MSTATAKNLTLRTESGVLHLTLSRADTRNALSAELIEEILFVFANLDETVRTIIIRGAEGNFSAGGDIKDMHKLIEHGKRNDLESIAEYNALAGKLFHAVHSCKKAVIAVLEGAVMGGGMGLAAAADIAVAHKNTRFALPETGLGLIPAQVAPFLRARLGLSYARMLAVLGGQIDAEYALRIGLVHYLFADENELSTLLADLCKRIHNCAPQALADAKSLFLDEKAAQSEEPIHLGMLFARSLVSEEAQEGIKAFVEKRKASWCRR